MAKAPIGTLIDNVWTLRETKRDLEAKVKDIEEQIEVAETLIIKRLDAERSGTASSRRASVSISEHIVPTTKDWEKFMEYVIKSKQGHLVERRAATLACREVWEKGGSLPGLEPFTKRKLNIRTLS